MSVRLGDTTLFGFLVTAVAISLSGVMAPGPITAATLTAGTRSRHAGVLIALGHLVVELPLILLLVAGIGKFLESSGARVGIGLAGGAEAILDDLMLFEKWRQFGRPLLVGAVSFDLAVAPDIDMEVYCPELRIEHGFQVLAECALHPPDRGGSCTVRLGIVVVPT